MNQTVTNKYFEDLSSAMDYLNLNVRPTQIWNMDETSLSFVHSPHESCRQKRLQNLPGHVSDSQQTQTVLAGVNVARKCMPPLIVVKEKHLNNYMLIKAMTAQRGRYSPTNLKGIWRTS